jgi:hypothetical protein
MNKLIKSDYMIKGMVEILKLNLMLNYLIKL